LLGGLLRLPLRLRQDHLVLLAGIPENPPGVFLRLRDLDVGGLLSAGEDVDRVDAEGLLLGDGGLGADAVLLVPLLQPVDVRPQVRLLLVPGRHVFRDPVQERADLVLAVAATPERGARELLLADPVRGERLAFAVRVIPPRHLCRHDSPPLSLVNSSKWICAEGTPASSSRPTVL